MLPNIPKAPVEGSSIVQHSSSCGSWCFLGGRFHGLRGPPAPEVRPEPRKKFRYLDDIARLIELTLLPPPASFDRKSRRVGQRSHFLIFLSYPARRYRQYGCDPKPFARCNVPGTLSHVTREGVVNTAADPKPFAKCNVPAWLYNGGTFHGGSPPSARALLYKFGG